jgi:hypothetical protein
LGGLSTRSVCRYSHARARNTALCSSRSCAMPQTGQSSALASCFRLILRL